jgi:Caspase domain
MAGSPLPGDDHPLDLLRERIRQLHLHDGKPSTREIARRIGNNVISHTTVNSVLHCVKCPRWGNLELIVEVLGGETEEFRLLWIAAQDAPHQHAAANRDEAAQAQVEPAESHSTGQAEAGIADHGQDLLQNFWRAVERTRPPAKPSATRIPPIEYSGKPSAVHGGSASHHLAEIDYSESSAILIGVSKYRDAAFSALPAARNSLTGMRRILSDSRVGGWPSARVSVFQDPKDASQLALQLRRIARATKGLMLLYFVGHGILQPRGELVFALEDTDSDFADITGLEYSRVRHELLASPARAKLVILDCCYSGQAIEALSGSGGIADITNASGVYTLTASDYAAHVPPPDRQAGAFTSFTGEFIDLLQNGLPGGPAQLGLSDLYPPLSMRLTARGLPPPNARGTDDAGYLPFCRNIAYQDNPASGGSSTTLPRSPMPVGSAESDKKPSGILGGEACPRCGAWVVDPLMHQGAYSLMTCRSRCRSSDAWG